MEAELSEDEEGGGASEDEDEQGGDRELVRVCVVPLCRCSCYFIVCSHRG